MRRAGMGVSAYSGISFNSAWISHRQRSSWFIGVLLVLMCGETEFGKRPDAYSSSPGTGTPASSKYRSPHLHRESTMGARVCPSSVSEYSVLGGTTG